MAFGDGFGHAWTPMMELQGAWEDEPGADISWDVVPQFQVTLNTRQHVVAAAGLRVPVTNRVGRDVEFVFISALGLVRWGRPGGLVTVLGSRAPVGGVFR